MSRKPVSPNDPRILRTRLLIRSAFLDLIREKGFDAVSVQDITDRATLNRATFYLHYQDKHDLMESLIQEVLDELSVLPMPFVPARSQEADPERLSAFFVGFSIWYNVRNAVFGLLLVAIGIPLYFYFNRQKKETVTE